MKYIVIEKAFLDELVAEVNERIEEGYKPLGGICRSNGIGYVQAMIKEENK